MVFNILMIEIIFVFIIIQPNYSRMLFAFGRVGDVAGQKGIFYRQNPSRKKINVIIYIMTLRRRQ